jgi:hypothetical protein
MPMIGITLCPKVVKNGGPITSDVYKSHATNLWTRGALLKLASGLLTPVVDTSSAAAEIDQADTGATGIRPFIALEDHLTAGSVFVSVQEIMPDSVLELQVLASGGSAASDVLGSVLQKGTNYTGYQLTGASQVINGVTYTIHGRGVWGIDSDDTTLPILNVIDTQDNYEPFNPDNALGYVRVLAKLNGFVFNGSDEIE